MGTYLTIRSDDWSHNWQFFTEEERASLVSLLDTVTRGDALRGTSFLSNTILHPVNEEGEFIDVADEAWAMVPRHDTFRVNREYPLLSIDIVYYAAWDWMQANKDCFAVESGMIDLRMLVDVDWGIYSSCGYLYEIRGGGPVRHKIQVVETQMVKRPEETTCHEWSWLLLPDTTRRILDNQE